MLWDFDKKKYFIVYLLYDNQPDLKTCFVVEKHIHCLRI